MSTARAVLTRVRGVHSHDSPTGPCCLMREQVCELTPRRVVNTLGETVIMHHPIDRQILDSDHIKPVHDATAVLMGEVTPAPGDAFIDSCHDLAPLGAFWGILLRFA